MSDRSQASHEDSGDAFRQLLTERLGVGHTVLVAEDNEEHRYLYAHVLRLAGYEVLEAPDGERTLALARDRRPELVVLDLGLPILDGFQVLEALRANAATRDTRVIVVTVYTAPDDVERTTALGCELHLGKPARPTEVLEAVHRTLGLLPAPARGAG